MIDSKKFLGHYTTDIVTSLASAILLNTITRPVKWSGAVCLHIRMATIALDVNLTYLIIGGW